MKWNRPRSESIATSWNEFAAKTTGHPLITHREENYIPVGNLQLSCLHRCPSSIHLRVCVDCLHFIYLMSLYQVMALVEFTLHEFLPSVFNHFRMGLSILVSSLKPIQWTCSWTQASSLSSLIRIQARSLGLSSFPFLVHSAVQYTFQRYNADVKMGFWVDST